MKKKKGEKSLIEEYFFDTDCISAFLWVHGECILTKLYAKHIILPAQVYKEISKVSHLRKKVDTLITKGTLIIENMEVGSPEFQNYFQMTTNPEKGMRIIGSGEAACIAMAKERGGILASNNMRDISQYVKKYELKHVTTGDILIKALNTGIITEEDGNTIWSKMLRKKRWLPTKTFSDYLKR